MDRSAQLTGCTGGQAEFGSKHSRAAQLPPLGLLARTVSVTTIPAASTLYAAPPLMAPLPPRCAAVLPLNVESDRKAGLELSTRYSAPEPNSKGLSMPARRTAMPPPGSYSRRARQWSPTTTG